VQSENVQEIQKEMKKIRLQRLDQFLPNTPATE
jgi:hypothetical protein